ncbi:MAG: Asp-tRNA(Asn)/Glu-tRNA(Gln) amidotransferase subunit GatC [Candidatus Saccharimonadales bacterium]
MAKLTRDDVLNLAKLAQLHLADDEIEQYRTEISAILEYVELLKTVDLGEVEPTYQVTGMINSMRADTIKDYGATPTELLNGAPAKEANHLKVRRML